MKRWMTLYRLVLFGKCELIHVCLRFVYEKNVVFRVSPNMTIRELRRPIETLCGKESYFPRDFIYLRSVGRCLTKVKAKQEDELRVKNYRPPQVRKILFFRSNK